MKTLDTYLTLLIIGIVGVLTQETLPDTDIPSIISSHDVITPQENRNGWVNPEDLPSMPQCIAQQDPSTWLRSLTQCTHKQCTRHFGIICTHHMWLTQLSCLSDALSEDMLREYMPYCSRSVLAKAQLYRWTKEVTGRTWLLEPGDADGLIDLKPSDLKEGFDSVFVVDRAPTCLVASSSKPNGEGFRRIMASCEFISTTQHTGNAQRPWEYHEDIQSMISLDAEIVGYDLVQSYRIEQGRYFDKACFCTNFALDLDPEPCRDGNRSPDMTRERMWMDATCGPTSLPANWTVGLRITGPAYIPLMDWTWPSCVDDFSTDVLDRKDTCAVDVVEADDRGYGGASIRSVERSCFCNAVRYESCEGSCHVFEGRIEYVNWLHNLCSSVESWNGLPAHWRQLAQPTVRDMTPWEITPKAPDDLHHGSSPADKTCPSNSWKLGSIALINIATLIAFQFSTSGTTSSFAARILPQSWVLKGLYIASIHLFANWINAAIVQSMPGYEHVSIFQLTLLWSTLPRLTWLPILLVSMQSLKDGIEISSAGAALVAEVILQSASAYPMLATTIYGFAHNFYSGALIEAPAGGLALTMYLAALMWVAVMVLTGVLAFRTLAHDCNAPSARTTKGLAYRKSYRKSNFVEERGFSSDECLPLTDEDAIPAGQTAYGTVPVRHEVATMPTKMFERLCSLGTSNLIPLWIIQCMFWGGFIGFSLDEYCPPQLEVLTAVWIGASVIGVMIGSPQG